MRQASRHSWRIGQTEPVPVVFMAYGNTLRADALKLVAKKLQRSLAVEGELPEDGLAAYGDDGEDLMLALARRIVAGEEDADSVQTVFAQAQQVAAEAEALLVDAEWQPPGPVAVEAVTVGAGSDERPSRSGRCSRGRSSWPPRRFGGPLRRSGRPAAPCGRAFLLPCTPVDGVEAEPPASSGAVVGQVRVALREGS